MPKTNRPLTVVALLASMFMAAMEMTVVSTAMPTVIGDLGGIHLFAWVFTAYMLAATVTVPAYGKLADLYGRKPILLFGIMMFLIGSAASGQARSIGQLIAFRAVQGLGAGSMQPTALTIVGDIFDVDERSRMQGVFGAVWGVAGLIGPILGGLIVKWLSWRWVFYINVPFGAVSAVLLVAFFREDVQKKKRVLDLAGAALLTVAVVALLLGSRGGTALGAAALVALAALAAFYVVERRTPEPILPFDLFAKRIMAVATILGALVGAAMISTVTFVPLYVQAVLGGSPTDAGSAITPMVVGWPIMSALGGRILPRVGFRPLVWSGLALTALAATELALLLSPSMTLGVFRVTTALFGAGLGFANTSLLIAVQTSVEWKQRGVATASTMFFRTIGGTLAVGALGSALTRRLTQESNAPIDAANALLGPDHGRSLPPSVLQSLSSGLGAGLGTVFWAIAAMALICFVVSWFFPYVSLRAGEEQVEREITDPAPTGH